MKPRNALRLDRYLGRRFVYPLHRSLYRMTGGLVGHRTPEGTVLLLTTTGRKTGQRRTQPLLYCRDGDDFVVVASNGARDRHPAWYLNVQAHPDVELRAGRTHMKARASVATPDEKARLWPKLTDYYKGWAYYQTQTDREIPVVVLRPS